MNYFHENPCLSICIWRTLTKTFLDHRVYEMARVCVFVCVYVCWVDLGAVLGMGCVTVQ